ncbi:hypothetical protein PVAP13_7NG226034 [Panicum virgatum]|uniref:Uncharacterized protein n=1 Tax=Panicum virgatum TaxID=38727 RepID=A0A8T0PYK8_PANVG|nr:hypothetical protein PVAP13_7NG226034 [Panicum virgatum]
MMHSLKRLTTSLKQKWTSSLEQQRPPPYLFHQQRETSHQGTEQDLELIEKTLVPDNRRTGRCSIVREHRSYL